MTAELDIRRTSAPVWCRLMNSAALVRQIRLLQRRPDTYRLVTTAELPVLARYGVTAG